MLAPCHSYRLTPSAPLGADRLIGSYCSTSESEEGKLWPLPCSLASLFPFTAWFSCAPSLNFLPFFHYGPFTPRVHFFLFWFHGSPPFACPLISCAFSPFVLVPPSHLAVSSFPLSGSSPPCICHSHSPSLFISRLYVSVYPGLGCHKQLGRSHSLLLHLLAWSPISLYQHCHLFFLHCSPLSVSCALSIRLCHHLHLSTIPSALITLPSQSNPVGPIRGDFMVKSMF